MGAVLPLNFCSQCILCTASRKWAPIMLLQYIGNRRTGWAGRHNDEDEEVVDV